MAYIEPIDYYKNGRKKPRSKCRKWRIYAYSGVKDPKTGKYGRRTENFHGTETEALAEAALFEARVKSTVSSTMPFGDYAQMWLKAREADPDIQESTTRRDHSFVKTLKIMFKDKRLCDIDVKACEDFIKELKTNGSPHGKKDLKLSYISALETRLSEILEDAMRAELIPKNPMRLVKKRTPKGAQDHDNAPDVDQMQQLVSKLDTRDRYQCGIYLAARLGMRRGEICGLRWRDVDFKHHTITIRQALKIDGTIGKTKTERSTRPLAMTPSIEEALKIRKKAQEEGFEAKVRIRMLKAKPDMRDVLVMADELNQPTSCPAMSSYWNKHRWKYGLQCSFHELRHGFASFLAHENVHVSVMQQILGHKSAVTSLNVYTHVNPSAVTAAMDTMENAFILEVDMPEEEDGAEE